MKDKAMPENVIRSEINKFIIQGINITKLSQEKNAVYRDKLSDFDYLESVFKKYILWKEDLKNFLNCDEVTSKVDVDILFEANSVPWVIPGGIFEYRDAKTIEYQNFLKNIREETQKTTNWLRNIKDEFYKYGYAEFKNRTLYFHGKEIVFEDRKQNQRDLLKILFTNKNKKWAMDELMDKWDEAQIDKGIKGKKYWRTLNSAADDINTAVAIETQIKDFIIKSTKEMQINPKYI